MTDTFQRNGNAIFTIPFGNDPSIFASADIVIEGQAFAGLLTDEQLIAALTAFVISIKDNGVNFGVPSLVWNAVETSDNVFPSNLTT